MNGRTFIAWAVIGTVFATVLVWAGAPEVGGVAGMLRVGEESGLRPMIEEQLGDIPLARGTGHDGQYYYAIGLDLLGSEVPDLIDDAGYRYRRILLPLLASIGGLLDGWPLLYGMIAVTVLSMGIAAAAVAGLARQLGLSQLVALAVLFNPGMLLSVRLLTPDALSMALMTIALLALVNVQRRSPAVLFSLSVLSKEAYLLTPAGLAASRDRSKWLLIGAPTVSLLLWIGWVTYRMEGGASGENNFGIPFRGIIDTFEQWSTLGGEAQLYVVFALASVLAGLVVGILRRSWLRWPVLFWSLIGVLSSTVVWADGNNAARVFAPLAVLIALSFGSWPEDSNPPMLKAADS